MKYSDFELQVLENLDNINSLNELNDVQKYVRRSLLFSMCGHNLDIFNKLDAFYNIDKTKELLYRYCEPI